MIKKAIVFNSLDPYATEPRAGSKFVEMEFNFDIDDVGASYLKEKIEDCFSEIFTDFAVLTYIN